MKRCVICSRTYRSASEGGRFSDWHGSSVVKRKAHGIDKPFFISQTRRFLHIFVVGVACFGGRPWLAIGGFGNPLSQFGGQHLAARALLLAEDGGRGAAPRGTSYVVE